MMSVSRAKEEEDRKMQGVERAQQAKRRITQIFQCPGLYRAGATWVETSFIRSNKI